MLLSLTSISILEFVCISLFKIEFASNVSMFLVTNLLIGLAPNDGSN